ncbi:MAG: hypothetical protein KA143_05450 [Saprospiraceae bacterium]|nr:hypothetical protein [Saprospiraceae bacterium]
MEFFPTNDNFTLFSSISNDLSNMLKLRPIVPRKGNAGPKSGTSISIYAVIRPSQYQKKYNG